MHGRRQSVWMICYDYASIGAGREYYRGAENLRFPAVCFRGPLKESLVNVAAARALIPPVPGMVADAAGKAREQNISKAGIIDPPLASPLRSVRNAPAPLSWREMDARTQKYENSPFSLNKSSLRRNYIMMFLPALDSPCQQTSIVRCASNDLVNI